MASSLLIPGDYQFKARYSGFVVQRFWHFLKARTVQYFAHPKSSGCVLDIGCGSGVISDVLASSGAKVIAIDSNPEAIRFAESTFPRSNLQFQTTAIESCSFQDESFDAIYLLEFIEHLPWDDVKLLVLSLKKWLKPGGSIFLTTPNYHSAWPVIEILMDICGLAPKLRGQQHFSRPTPSLIRALAAGCGLRLTHLERMAGVAPFISILGWRLAEHVDNIERKLRRPFGMLLFARMERMD